VTGTGVRGHSDTTLLRGKKHLISVIMSFLSLEMCVFVCPWGPGEGIRSESLELELPIVVSCLMCVLGTELRSSARAASGGGGCTAVSPALEGAGLKTMSKNYNGKPTNSFLPQDLCTYWVCIGKHNFPLYLQAPYHLGQASAYSLRYQLISGAEKMTCVLPILLACLVFHLEAL